MLRSAAAGLVVLAVSGCAPGGKAPAAHRETAGRVCVAASVAPHAWLVREIAGDAAEVVTVLPPAADPHSHLPTDAEATRLARASLLFRSGVPFENGNWFGALTARGVEAVDLRQGVELLDDAHEHDQHHGQDHDHQGSDPHTWLSPRRLAIQAETVATALAAQLPQHADQIRQRADSAVAKLAALDAELAASLAPYRGRSFLVLHPSWSYFAADYGLRQLAVEAGGAQPSDAQLTALLEAARSDRIRTLFAQPQSAARLPGVLAEALGGRVELLDPLAADVPANLRRVADRLIESWRLQPNADDMSLR